MVNEEEEKKVQWDDVADAIAEEYKNLLGNRVAVLAHPTPKTFGNSVILTAETHERLYKNYSGNIVAVGVKVDQEDVKQNGAYLFAGDVVTYNKYNVISFRLNLEGLDEPVEVDVLSIEDLYWSW